MTKIKVMGTELATKEDLMQEIARLEHRLETLASLTLYNKDEQDIFKATALEFKSKENK